MNTHEQQNYVDNIVLTVINDGSGSSCGASYEQRVTKCRGILKKKIEQPKYTESMLKALLFCYFTGLISNLVKSYGTTVQISRPIGYEAAEQLAEYYFNHITEMDRLKPDI